MEKYRNKIGKTHSNMAEVHRKFLKNCKDIKTAYNIDLKGNLA